MTAVVEEGSGEGSAGHVPVMVRECLEALAAGPGGLWIDATLGAGGHAEAILEATSPDGRLLGIDRDVEALGLASERLAGFGHRFRAARGDFGDLAHLAEAAGWNGVRGILLDLGVSSMQLDRPGRGFSFRADAPLDMRMDRTSRLTAREVVNTAGRAELARIFREYGEEWKAERVASAIVEARRKKPVETTMELARIVARAVGRSGGRINPATRVFQALRIHVNAELESLARGLPQAAALLAPGGRLAVISYHSLEDRVVKETFRRLSGRCWCPPDSPVCRCGAKATMKILTRRPVTPGPRELADNRRARSAKLRAAEKLG